jgi:transcriptional accessory protein Tex/SPT6
LDRPIQ